MKNKKYWSKGQVAFAAYLAGPLGGSYFIGNNYRTMGEDAKARAAYLFGIATTLSFFLMPWGFITWLENTSFRSFIPIAIAIMMMYFSEYAQKESLDKLAEDGAERNSHWKAVGVVLLFLIALFFPLFLLFLYVVGL